MLTFEKRDEALISKSAFAQRVLRSVGIALGFIGISLGVGVLGYRVLEGLAWVDCFLNATMILGGMGPVDVMKTFAGKIFAGCYALYSGLAFLVVAGFIFGPLAHRLLHHFHYEADEESSKS
jgi:hypothetical protein